MSENYSTLTSEQLQSLASMLAKRNLPVIKRFEPVADFEELVTFVTENPTPVGYAGRNPAWQTEAVAARLIEAVAIAAHEPMLDAGWQVLVQIMVEHAEYLFTFHPSPHSRERLHAGAALALLGGVCYPLPESEMWRLAGFARMAETLSAVADGAAASHILDPIDGAFELAVALNLPIFDAALERYNAALNRNLRYENRVSLASKVVAPTNVDNAKAWLEHARLLSTQTRPHAADPIRITGEIGVAALRFSEGCESAQLLKLAVRRLGWIFDTHFYPDGFHIDGTGRSHLRAFTELAEFYRLAKSTGFQFPEGVDQQFEKTVEVFMYLSQPDFHLPPLGENSPSQIGVKESCRIGHAIFDRPDFRYVASSGQAGEPPRETSHAFPYVGYYVMRNSWRSDAQYLMFDGSGRMDRLSFILYAYGRPLIIRNISEHQSVRIDGMAKYYARMDDVAIIPDPDTRWLTTLTFDFVEGWHKDGYATNDTDSANFDFQHKRSIFHVKDEYFILHDLILGAGEHRLEQRFNLASRNRVEIGENGGVRTTESNRSNIAIVPVDATDLTVETEPTVTFTAKRSLPAVMNCVLFPQHQGIVAMPDIQSVEVTTDPDVLATGFTVVHNGWLDLILISDDGFATMRTTDVEFVGEYLFLRCDATGRVQRLAMIHGQFVQFKGDVLVELPEPEHR